jgi:hypothetical protein
MRVKVPRRIFATRDPLPESTLEKIRGVIAFPSSARGWQNLCESVISLLRQYGTYRSGLFTTGYGAAVWGLENMRTKTSMIYSRTRGVGDVTSVLTGLLEADKTDLRLYRSTARVFPDPNERLCRDIETVGVGDATRNFFSPTPFFASIRREDGEREQYSFGRIDPHLR